MRYLIHSKWSFTEHFAIDDGTGTPVFDVRGNLSLTQHLTMRDAMGQEVAEIKKHLMTTRHDILMGGQRVAEVHHEGFFGEHYEIDSQFGRISAKGNFAGWNYNIHQQGQPVAMVSRQLAFGEKFLVETADNVNDPFILAVVLAIDAIHKEREQDHDQGGFGNQGGIIGDMLGGGGGGGGIFGGNFP
ncbi:MAG TPA: hypothetical protein VMA95_20140 [Streptosporangiaceae bacterium]|nr:hypothetical protein [Streptosporangiaceae bacterium]